MGPSLPDETSLPTLGYGITGASPIAQVVVQVSGELDIATAPRLAEELRRAVRHAAEVVVDLEQVEFMDCAGVRVLLSAAEAADAAGSAVAVTRGPAQVQRLFALTGADSLLSIVPLPGRQRLNPKLRDQVKAGTSGRASSAVRRSLSENSGSSSLPAR